ncbi:hypothetical protein WJX74_010438 [Apatococcus lobatus]|uniref:Myb-like domain-containing protein n=1 Tax=Apatococcus lobatus TaxID=904363 RepID=A0AAW1S0F9_9CHLO
MQEPLSDAALDELDAFDFDVSDENSELGWVPEDVQSSDVEHKEGSSKQAPTQQHQARPEAVGPSDSLTGSASQAQDAFEELLGQLHSTATPSKAPPQGQCRTPSSFAAANALQSGLPSPPGAVSPGFDISSMPDVSIEELDALMHPDMDQNQPAEDDNEYEAFLKVLRGEADMELPEDDLEDEDFTIDLEELLNFPEAPTGGELGPTPERRLTRASWRPAPLPPATRKHGAPKPYRPRAQRQTRPLASTIVRQLRQGQGQSGKRNYAMPALIMPVPPSLWQPPMAMPAEQAACLYQQMAQHTQLLVQSTMLMALQPGKHPVAGFLSSLLSQLLGFVARQSQARQAALQPPWSPLALGMCSGPDWLKAHAVVVGPPRADGASRSQQEPAYFLRPVWSSADVPTLAIMPQFLGAIYQATAAPVQPHQDPPGSVLQATYRSMMPFFDPALLPGQGVKSRPGAWMPAEDILLEMGIRRFGHQYEQVRLALVPVHPVYDIMARFRLNNANSNNDLRTTWTQETEDLLILGIRRCGADYHRIHKEWLPCHPTQDIAAMHRSMFRSYGPGIFQEASPEELAPLQLPEVAVIAAGLQLHGQNPQRWEFIAGSLPGRKPHTLARLWFHHASGDKPKQRGLMNTRTPSRLASPSPTAVSTILQTHGSALLPAAVLAFSQLLSLN